MTRTRTPSQLIGNVLYWIALGAAFVFFLFPLVWMLITSIKQRADVTTLPATFVPWVQFAPTTFNYLSVFTTASELGTVTTGQQAVTLSAFPEHLFNSVVISGTATVLAVMLGTLAAYAFSRFRIPGEGDLLFFILSTRMMPAIVVLIPIFLMFTLVGLRETFLGITLLY